MGGIYGYAHTTGGYDGGQAEYLRVPMATVGTTVIPQDMHEQYRLEFVRSYAQCESVDFNQVGDMAVHLKNMTDGLGPDVYIDAVGSEAPGMQGSN